MQITQRQKDDLQRQLPEIVSHWREIAKLIGRHHLRLPSSLDGFSSEEAEKIDEYLKNH